MATGASHADIGIMLIDARHGVKRQTRRHAAILDLMGVRRVVLAVNKMDLVGWDEARFREIEREFQTLVLRFGFEQAITIPVSAKLGDNVVRPSGNMSWYRGPSLLDHLNNVPDRGKIARGDFRFPVQLVLRDGADFRGLAGTVSSGAIRVGDDVCEHVSGVGGKIRRIVTMDGDLEVARQGQAVVIALDRDLDISRGAVLARPDAAPILARQIRARLVWLADTPLDTDHGLLLRTATDLVPVASFAVRSRLDLETLAETEAPICQPNDVLVADISLARAVAIDRFIDNKELGSFLLLDSLSGATLAGGVVEQAESKASLGAQVRFRLGSEVLLRELCAGLSPGDHEYRRRAKAVTAILEAAGVVVELEPLIEAAEPLIEDA